MNAAVMWIYVGDYMSTEHIQTDILDRISAYRLRWKCRSSWRFWCFIMWCLESGCLRVQPYVCFEINLRLNTTTRPIAKKYREEKLERTLKREFKSTWNRSGVNLRNPKYRMGKFIVNGVRLPLVRDAPGGPFMVPLARARLHRIENSVVVVVHFSPSRTSRPVVYWQTIGRPAVCTTVHRRYRAATNPFSRLCMRPFRR